MADEMKVLRVSDKVAESSFSMTVRSFELLLVLDCDRANRLSLRAGEISNELALPTGIAGWRMRVGTEAQTKIVNGAWQRAIFYAAGADVFRFGFETFYGPALVRRLEITTDPTAVGAFRIMGELSSFGPPKFSQQGDTNTSRTEFPTPIRITSESSSRVVSAYREGPIVPGEGPPPLDKFAYEIWDRQLTEPNIYGGIEPFLQGESNPSTDTKSEDYRPPGDCGGRAIDFNGAPIPHAVPQTKVTLDIVRRLPYWNWTNNSDNSTVTLSTLDAPIGFDSPGICIAGFDDFIGCRNSESLLGYPIGTLLFESTNLTPLQDEFSIFRMVFLYDQWKHATQVPRPTYGTTVGAMTTQTGKMTPTIPPVPELDPRGIQHYTGVYWQQSYLDMFTLDPAFFYQGEIDYITKIGECSG